MGRDFLERFESHPYAETCGARGFDVGSLCVRDDKLLGLTESSQPGG